MEPIHPQHGPPDAPELPGRVQVAAAEHGEVDPVGEEGDVAAARGQVVGQGGGGGEDHIGGGGQVPLPTGGEAGPVGGAVVDQAAVCKVVQQVDLGGTGGPEEGLPKAVAEHGPGDERPLPPPAPRAGEPAAHRQQAGGGEGVEDDVGPDLAAGIPMAALGGAGGPEIEDLPPETGGELLGAAGHRPPGRIGEDDILTQKGAPPGMGKAVGRYGIHRDRVDLQNGDKAGGPGAPGPPCRAHGGSRLGIRGSGAASPPPHCSGAPPGAGGPHRRRGTPCRRCAPRRRRCGRTASHRSRPSGR